MGIRIPFYEIGSNIWIDAYLIANVEFKYNRILMIKEHVDEVSSQIKPLSFNEVVNLVMEGYNDLLSLINDVKNKVETRRGIRILEVLALPMYNPSQYLARRENEAVILPLLNMLKEFYDDLIQKMNKFSDVRLGSLEISVKDNKVFANGKIDVIYTNFYENDDLFRAKLNEVLNVV